MPEGLSRSDFDQRVYQRLGDFYLWIVEARVRDRGRSPVALVVAKGSEHRLEPYVFHFPWSTDRNKLEVAAAWLNETRKTGKISLIVSRAADKPFFQYLTKYGVLTGVGPLKGWWDNEDAHIFQTLPVGGK